MSAPVTQLTPFGHALAGALGGVFSNAIVYPLDTVKTVIQATRSDHKGKAKDGAARLSMISIILKIFQEEGIAGYYQGFGATMLNTFSTQYAYFFFYSVVRSSYIKRLARKLPPGSPLPALSTAAELLLGAIAGALAQIFTIPVSVIAVRQQIAHSNRRSLPPPSEKSFADAVNNTAPEGKVEEIDTSFFGVARKLVEEEGVTGLWLGIKPGLVLTVNPAITYGVFERVKSLFLAGSNGKKMKPWVAFAVGASSKTLATVVTYPYIMAKVRIQAGTEDDEDDEVLPSPITAQNGGSIAAKKRTPKHAGAIELLKHVFRDQGFLGWYRGMQAQILKAVLSQALLFVSKDQFEMYALILMNIYYRLRG